MDQGIRPVREWRGEAEVRDVADLRHDDQRGQALDSRIHFRRLGERGAEPVDDHLQRVDHLQPVGHRPASTVR
jgi:hypothetical protein